MCLLTGPHQAQSCAHFWEPLCNSWCTHSDWCGYALERLYYFLQYIILGSAFLLLKMLRLILWQASYWSVLLWMARGAEGCQPPVAWSWIPPIWFFHCTITHADDLSMACFSVELYFVWVRLKNTDINYFQWLHCISRKIMMNDQTNWIINSLLCKFLVNNS